MTECDYRASVVQASVQVKVRELFTIVSVNGVDVYFHRLTGKIDGIGVSPNADCMSERTLGSTHSGAPLGHPRLEQAHRRKG